MTLKNTNGNYWRFHGLTHEHLTHVVMSVRDLVSAASAAGTGSRTALSSQPRLQMRSKARKRGRLIHIGHLNRILSIAISAEHAIHITWFDIPTLSCTKSASVYFSKFLRTKSDLRTALFWVITQRVVVISYRRFGTAYRSHLQGSRIQKQKV
jgi:hypothetical protein